MKVRLAALHPAPELCQAILAGLPRPFEPGDRLELRLSQEPCRDRHRGQVDAACLVDLLPAPPPGWALLALTDADLFLPALTHVFGASRLGQGRGLLSWHRLQQPPELLRPRLLTEAVHELGHSVGLVHCAVPQCAMHRALWVESIDLKRPELCPACLESLPGR